MVPFSGPLCIVDAIWFKYDTAFSKVVYARTAYSLTHSSSALASTYLHDSVRTHSLRRSRDWQLLRGWADTARPPRVRASRRCAAECSRSRRLRSRLHRRRSASLPPAGRENSYATYMQSTAMKNTHLHKLQCL